MKCCFCDKFIVGYGNNAKPMKNGICCEDCNIKKVIPYRIKLYQEKEKMKEEMKDLNERY